MSISAGIVAFEGNFLPQVVRSRMTLVPVDAVVHVIFPFVPNRVDPIDIFVELGIQLHRPTWSENRVLQSIQGVSHGWHGHRKGTSPLVLLDDLQRSYPELCRICNRYKVDKTREDRRNQVKSPQTETSPGSGQSTDEGQTTQTTDVLNETCKQHTSGGAKVNSNSERSPKSTKTSKGNCGDTVEANVKFVEEGFGREAPALFEQTGHVNNTTKDDQNPGDDSATTSAQNSKYVYSVPHDVSWVVVDEVTTDGEVSLDTSTCSSSSSERPCHPSEFNHRLFTDKMDTSNKGPLTDAADSSKDLSCQQKHTPEEFPRQHHGMIDVSSRLYCVATDERPCSDNRKNMQMSPLFTAPTTGGRKDHGAYSGVVKDCPSSPDASQSLTIGASGGETDRPSNEGCGTEANSVMENQPVLEERTSSKADGVYLATETSPTTKGCGTLLSVTMDQSKDGESQESNTDDTNNRGNEITTDRKSEVCVTEAEMVRRPFQMPVCDIDPEDQSSQQCEAVKEATYPRPSASDTLRPAGEVRVKGDRNLWASLEVLDFFCQSNANIEHDQGRSLLNDIDDKDRSLLGSIAGLLRNNGVTPDRSDRQNSGKIPVRCEMVCADTDGPLHNEQNQADGVTEASKNEDADGTPRQDSGTGCSVARDETTNDSKKSALHTVTRLQPFECMDTVPAITPTSEDVGEGQVNIHAEDSSGGYDESMETSGGEDIDLILECSPQPTFAKTRFKLCQERTATETNLRSSFVENHTTAKQWQVVSDPKGCSQHIQPKSEQDRNTSEDKTVNRVLLPPSPNGPVRVVAGSARCAPTTREIVKSKHPVLETLLIPKDPILHTLLGPSTLFGTNVLLNVSTGLSSPLAEEARRRVCTSQQDSQSTSNKISEQNMVSVVPSLSVITNHSSSPNNESSLKSHTATAHCKTSPSSHGSPTPHNHRSSSHGLPPPDNHQSSSHGPPPLGKTPDQSASHRSPPLGKTPDNHQSASHGLPPLTKAPDNRSSSSHGLPPPDNHQCASQRSPGKTTDYHSSASHGPPPLGKTPDNHKSASHGPPLLSKMPGNRQSASHGPTLLGKMPDNRSPASHGPSPLGKTPGNHQSASHGPPLLGKTPDNHKSASHGPPLLSKMPGNRQSASHGPTLLGKMPDNRSPASHGPSPLGKTPGNHQSASHGSPPLGKTPTIRPVDSNGSPLCEAPTIHQPGSQESPTHLKTLNQHPLASHPRGSTTDKHPPVSNGPALCGKTPDKHQSARHHSSPLGETPDNHSPTNHGSPPLGKSPASHPCGSNGSPLGKTPDKPQSGSRESPTHGKTPDKDPWAAQPNGDQRVGHLWKINLNKKDVDLVQVRSTSAFYIRAIAVSTGVPSFTSSMLKKICPIFGTEYISVEQAHNGVLACFQSLGYSQIRCLNFLRASKMWKMLALLSFLDKAFCKIDRKERPTAEGALKQAKETMSTKIYSNEDLVVRGSRLFIFYNDDGAYIPVKEFSRIYPTIDKADSLIRTCAELNITTGFGPPAVLRAIGDLSRHDLDDFRVVTVSLNLRDLAGLLLRLENISETKCPRPEPLKENPVVIQMEVTGERLGGLKLAGAVTAATSNQGLVSKAATIDISKESTSSTALPHTTSENGFIDIDANQTTSAVRDASCLSESPTVQPEHTSKRHVEPDSGTPAAATQPLETAPLVHSQHDKPDGPNTAACPEIQSPSSNSAKTGLTSNVSGVRMDTAASATDTTVTQVLTSAQTASNSSVSATTDVTVERRPMICDSLNALEAFVEATKTHTTIAGSAEGIKEDPSKRQASHVRPRVRDIVTPNQSMAKSVHPLNKTRCGEQTPSCNTDETHDVSAESRDKGLSEDDNSSAALDLTVRKEPIPSVTRKQLSVRYTTGIVSRGKVTIGDITVPAIKNNDHVFVTVNSFKRLTKWEGPLNSLLCEKLGIAWFSREPRPDGVLHPRDLIKLSSWEKMQEATGKEVKPPSQSQTSQSEKKTSLTLNPTSSDAEVESCNKYASNNDTDRQEKAKQMYRRQIKTEDMLTSADGQSVVPPTGHLKVQENAQSSTCQVQNISKQQEGKTTQYSAHARITSQPLGMATGHSAMTREPRTSVPPGNRLNETHAPPRVVGNSFVSSPESTQPDKPSNLPARTAQKRKAAKEVMTDIPAKRNPLSGSSDNVLHRNLATAQMDYLQHMSQLVCSPSTNIHQVKQAVNASPDINRDFHKGNHVMLQLKWETCGFIEGVPPQKATEHIPIVECTGLMRVALASDIVSLFPNVSVTDFMQAVGQLKLRICGCPPSVQQLFLQVGKDKTVCATVVKLTGSLAVTALMLSSCFTRRSSVEPIEPMAENAFSVTNITNVPYQPTSRSNNGSNANYYPTNEQAHRNANYYRRDNEQPHRHDPRSFVSQVPNVNCPADIATTSTSGSPADSQEEGGIQILAVQSLSTGEGYMTGRPDVPAEGMPGSIMQHMSQQRRVSAQPSQQRVNFNMMLAQVPPRQPVSAFREYRPVYQNNAVFPPTSPTRAHGTGVANWQHTPAGYYQRPAVPRSGFPGQMHTSNTNIVGPPGGPAFNGRLPQ